MSSSKCFQCRKIQSSMLSLEPHRLKSTNLSYHQVNLHQLPLCHLQHLHRVFPVTGPPAPALFQISLPTSKPYHPSTLILRLIFLRQHYKNHTRPFKCPACPARRATRCHLTRHFNERHHAAKKFYCPVHGCIWSKKYFPRSDNLKRHMKTHGLVDRKRGV